MMNHIRKTGIVTAALAASTLLIPEIVTASASPNRNYTPLNDRSVSIDRHQRQTDDYAFVPRWERRQAVRLCRTVIQSETSRAFPGPFGASNYKFRPDVYRSGMRGKKLIVSAPVEVHGKFASTRVPSTCVVRNNRVISLEYDPFWAKRKIRSRIPRSLSGGPRARQLHY